MTKLLERAFEEAGRLPPAQQDAFAEFLLAELEDEQRWDRAFANSGDVLSRLAAQAREEARQGRAKPLSDALGEGDGDLPSPAGGT